MDFTPLLLSRENIKKTIQVVWMPRWFCGEIWLHSIHFWNWWSLCIFTWLHLYKICGLLTALSAHEGSTLGFVRVPVHCILHHFTVMNCCHHPDHSVPLLILSSFPQEGLVSNIHFFFCGKMKEREVYEIFICISISDNFFLFALTLSMGFLRYIDIFHSWTVKVLWGNQMLDYFDP